ncbi:flavin-containing monooxygenase [Nocardioides cynanchi]|uniref:flavin-containing monooxygenase n=1 Tax=Nocardioides cynanchi TaxID=2558918 RepID=UPI001EE1C14C|nr:NAD(P)/FAD-dependent oxidoreductase [Nocardioides cynanchi]
MSHVDVLIIGAGLSGIGAAAHLTRELPGTSYAVLEARAVSGGTWDLFRYPGIRSDSDMYTMGYRFKPWLDQESLAPGPRILDYVRETAREYDVERHIRYDHRVVRASWSSQDARWTVEAERDGATVTFTAGFLWSCRGYYDYERGHEPEFAGAADFAGPIVHPQHWPDDLEWEGKRVVVIGSGATAVTLVPTLARDAAHVTMLQRSPSYVMSLARRDPVALRIRRWLPDRLAHRVVRWKNITTTAAFYRLSRARPALVRRLVRKQNLAQLPEGYDVDTHFTPAYDPWDQRMCFVPDGDLFKAVRRGTAEVVTSTIERFDESGVVLTGGRHLDADLIVTATGLRLSPFGDIALEVDGAPVDPSAEMTYRALMLTGVPNFVFTVGYTNASWTLKVDLVAEFCCRLLAHLSEHGYRSVVAVRDPSVTPLPFMDFTSGYVLRALDQLPRQGDREPWRLRQSYLHDRRTIRHAGLDDGVLAFR